MGAKKITCLRCSQINRVNDEKPLEQAVCGTCRKPLMTDKAVDIDFNLLNKAASNDDIPLIVDFWTPWCGPCKSMAPEFSKAAQTVSGKARLVKVNTQTHQKAGQKFGIRGIPTMVKFKGGKEIKRQSGATQSAAIISWALR